MQEAGPLREPTFCQESRLSPFSEVSTISEQQVGNFTAVSDKSTRKQIPSVKTTRFRLGHFVYIGKLASSLSWKAVARLACDYSHRCSGPMLTVLPSCFLTRTVLQCGASCVIIQLRRNWTLNYMTHASTLKETHIKNEGRTCTSWARYSSEFSKIWRKNIMLFTVRSND